MAYGQYYNPFKGNEKCQWIDDQSVGILGSRTGVSNFERIHPRFQRGDEIQGDEDVLTQ